MHVIISSSLSTNSNSRKMALLAQKIIGCDSYLIDLRDYPLPLCDGSGKKPDTIEQIHEKVASAHSIILAGPVYNYDLNAAAKNFIEWTGSAWDKKVVACIVAAGGKNSYMAPLSFMNSLMLDFRCIMVPRYVYADRTSFSDGEIDPKVVTRMKELVTYTTKLGTTIHQFHSDIK